MRRRTFLHVLGTGTALAVTGCLGGGQPEAANEYGYELADVNGVGVPLAPLDDVIRWYENEAAVFGDARSRAAYDQAHIQGSVHSPAPDGLQSEDPLDALSTDETIVTYCGCPHHLSTLRAARLISSGYIHSYAIDEGFYAWSDAGYPLAGQNVQSMPPAYEISGTTNAASSGSLAWAWHDKSGQREAAPIQPDGSFWLTLRFYDIEPSAIIRVVTPDGMVERPLGALVQQGVFIETE